MNTGQKIKIVFSIEQRNFFEKKLKIRIIKKLFSQIIVN